MCGLGDVAMQGVWEGLRAGVAWAMQQCRQLLRWQPGLDVCRV